MVEAFGRDRPAAVTRELTKMFETVVPGTLAELAEKFAGEPPKGEIVIVVAPPSAPAVATAEDADALLAALLTDRSLGDAATEAAAVTGLPRRELYRRALAIRGKGRAEGSGNGDG